MATIKSIDEVAQIGVPHLTTMDMTNTEAAFRAAETLLSAEMPNLPDGTPAPLVCHMTDGEVNTGGSPLPVAQRIMNLGVTDGNVLIENIYVSQGAQQLRNPAADVKAWSGITSAAEALTSHAKMLFDMSSEIPDSYRAVMSEMGYKGLQPGARMMFAGNDRNLVKMAFVMSTATPIK